ncbi:MAG: aminotransferase class IV [Rickettsiales bacterium]|nr:aminotransferase class IV [Rickettsiales bacterium]
MPNFIFKNNQLVKRERANIAIDDRGWLFGDGIFETCKIFNAKIYNFKAHQSRINEGLKNLKFPKDSANCFKNLEKKAQQLITKNKIKSGLLKISISRGSGSLGYLPTYDSQPLVIIQTFAARKLPAKINLGISSIKTPNFSFGKTLNALPYVLAKIEAQEKNLFDNVMLSEKKFIGETSSANIFWVKNGKIFTAKKSGGIIFGTVCQRLIKISPQKIYLVDAKISALKKADEIFLTNSAFGILSVDEFLGRKLSKNLANNLKEILEKDIEKLCQK